MYTNLITYGTDGSFMPYTFYIITSQFNHNIIDKDEIGYKIVNDVDYLCWYVKDYFESVDEMRNNKLKGIGI